jgi:hypothetical protein
MGLVTLTAGGCKLGATAEQSPAAVVSAAQVGHPDPRNVLADLAANPFNVWTISPRVDVPLGEQPKPTPAADGR